MKKIYVLCLAILLSSFVHCAEFKSPLAGVFEPSIGAFYQFSSEKLRLDIGNSFDLYKSTVCSNKISVGADFFTYTRLRTAGNFKFPVETSDYYFGLNSAYFDTVAKMPIAYRIRVAHISSHLVDGLSDSLTFRRLPFVYSREFVDILAAISMADLRLYAGVNFLYSTKPKDFALFHPQIGFDYQYNLSDNISFKAGYDFKLVGIDSKYYGVSNYRAGFAYKTNSDVQIFLGFYGYNGKSMHGMFYNERDDYTGIGFNFIF